MFSGAWRKAKLLSLYVAVSILVLVVYDRISSSFSPVGGKMLRYPETQMLEIVLIFSFLMLLYPRPGQGDWVRFLLPSLIVVVVYAFVDVFFCFFERVPRSGDLQAISDLYLAEPAYAVFACLPLFLIVAAIGYLSFPASRNGVIASSMKLGVRISSAVAGVMFLLSQPGQAVTKSLSQFELWSERANAQRCGRLSSIVHYLQSERNAYRKLHIDNNVAATEVESVIYPGQPAHRPNIHFIVLESFIDPRRLEGIRYNRSPLADELKPFLNANGDGFSHIITPIYGGGTVRTCFEILTGLQSLAAIEPIDYNLMEGGKIHDFPWRLAQFGYTPLATFATYSTFFNERRAAQSLSLDNALFLDEQRSPEERKKSPNFDGDVFEKNLGRVRELLQHEGGPLFSYTEGMYGHTPFLRDIGRQPDVIFPSPDSDVIRRVANIFYYRTKALGEYLSALEVLDPDAIVFVTSDHLPPILGSQVRITGGNRFENSALLLDGWRPQDISGKKTYQVPWIIWDRITGQSHERSLDRAHMERLYFAAIRQGLR